jgi:ParB-like chromosome segregation protein Spo0J
VSELVLIGPDEEPEDLNGVRIHPAADLFPLMGQAELAALAEDIAENGLLQPILLDDAGRVLDGRNRLRACLMACVTPRFMTIDGDDPLALVLSLNVSRRNTTASQRAIIAADAWEMARAVKIDRKRIRDRLADQFGISNGYIQQARYLVKHDPDAADAVKRGELLLAPAYEAARQRKLRQDFDQQELNRIRALYPDLAEQVDSGKLTLAQALREGDARAEKLRLSRYSATMNLLGGQRQLDQPDTAEHLEHTLALIDPKVEAEQGQQVNAACLRRVAAFASGLAETLERRA